MEAAANPNFTLPPRHAVSRIDVNPRFDGGIDIVLASRINPRVCLFAALITLLPLTASISLIGTTSRPLGGMSPLFFCLPFAAVSVAVMLLAWRNRCRWHLVITEDRILIETWTLRGRGEALSVTWSQVSGVRSSKAKTTSNFVAGEPPSASRWFGAPYAKEHFTLFGPAMTDVCVGGAGLTVTDSNWLRALLTGAVCPETRSAVLDEATRSPAGSAETAERAPGRLGQLLNLKVNRVPYVLAAVVALTLVNSYAGGVTLEQRWRDNVGNRFISSDSLWQSHVVCVASNNQISEAATSMNPFTISAHNTISVPYTPTGNAVWRLTMAGRAARDMERERREANEAAKVAIEVEWQRLIAEATQSEKTLPAKPTASQLNAIADKFQAVANWGKANRYFHQVLTVHHTAEEAYYALSSIATVDFAREDRIAAIAALQSATEIPGLAEGSRNVASSQIRLIKASNETLHQLFLRSATDRFPGER